MPRNTKSGKPPFQITKKVLEQAEEHAASGLTFEQIATVLGISISTLYKYKALDEKFSDAIKRGKSKGIEKVSNKLYENAKDGDNVAAIFYLKSRAQWSDKPTGNSVEFDISGCKTVAEKAQAVYDAVSSGKISPDVGALMLQSTKNLMDIEAASELKQRIESLEKMLNERS